MNQNVYLWKEYILFRSDMTLRVRLRVKQQASIYLSIAQTGTPVALMKTAVRRRLSTGPNVFSRTAVSIRTTVSVGQVDDMLWLW